MDIETNQISAVNVNVPIYLNGYTAEKYVSSYIFQEQMWLFDSEVLAKSLLIMLKPFWLYRIGTYVVMETFVLVLRYCCQA